MLVFQGNKLKKKKDNTSQTGCKHLYVPKKIFNRQKKKTEFALQKWYCLHLVHKCEAEVKLHS